MSNFNNNYSLEKKKFLSCARAAKIWFAVLLVLVMGFTGCVSGPKADGGSGRKQISFETSGNGTLVISNESGFDLVIFAGDVHDGVVLGGIRTTSKRAFDCSRVLKHDAGVFLCRAVKFIDYFDKDGKVTGDDVVFSALVFSTPSEVTITNHVGGDGFFYVENKSSCLLQLHMGSPYGEVLTSIPPQSFGKVYFVPNYRGQAIFCSYIAWDGKDENNLKMYQDMNGFRVDGGEDAVYMFSQPKALGNMFIKVY